MEFIGEASNFLRNAFKSLTGGNRKQKKKRTARAKKGRGASIIMGPARGLTRHKHKHRKKFL